jgi:hypothetical protein
VLDRKRHETSRGLDAEHQIIVEMFVIADEGAPADDPFRMAARREEDIGADIKALPDRGRRRRLRVESEGGQRRGRIGLIAGLRGRTGRQERRG